MAGSAAATELHDRWGWGKRLGPRERQRACANSCPLSDIVGQAVKGFGHSADMPYLFLLVETDCVAGLGGLELRNASGAKSGRVAASIFGESAENAPQRLFAFELRGEEYAAAARSCQTRSITAVLFNLPG